MSNPSGFYPTADKVLIHPTKVEEKTHGGIVLATKSKEKEEAAQVTGTIIAVGATATLCPEMDGINVGDDILFARYSGMEYPVDGVCYRIIRARDVVGRAERLPDSVIRGAQSTMEVFGINTPKAA
jgi:chaperonin GroES